jgi:hypothetical protein
MYYHTKDIMPINEESEELEEKMRQRTTNLKGLQIMLFNPTLTPPHEHRK